MMRNLAATLRLARPIRKMTMPPPPRILIVEDEEVLGDNLKAYLDRRATEVRIVRDGEHAVEILESFTPDAIVMDFRLPGMNGVDTYVEMMRDKATKIACVMITGEPTDDLSRNASASGIRSVLPKPFSFCELMAQLEPPLAPEAQAAADGAADASSATRRK
jgi:DNA-binding response OmpR family regulator